MKRILSLILALLLCCGFIVSCEKEEAPLESESSSSSSTESSSSSSESSSSSSVESSSSSSTESSSSSSESSSSAIDNSQKQPEILNNVTPEYFNAYTAYINFYRFNVEEGVTIVSTYEEYLKYLFLMPNETFEGITEETFESNFVVLINYVEGYIRDLDIYYNNFQKVENSYFLTCNLVSQKGRLFDQMLEPYIDVCVIPRALCQDDIASIELKIMWKEYKFEGEMYNSSCEVRTYLRNGNR